MVAVANVMIHATKVSKIANLPYREELLQTLGFEIMQLQNAFIAMQNTIQEEENDEIYSGNIEAHPGLL
jgi:hypothetical protein